MKKYEKSCWMKYFITWKIKKSISKYSFCLLWSLMFATSQVFSNYWSISDALLLFTPTLFPNSVRDINRFLQAVRISLILIDLCDVVFSQFLPLTICSNTNDEDFFHGETILIKIINHQLKQLTKYKISKLSIFRKDRKKDAKFIT